MQMYIYNLFSIITSFFKISIYTYTLESGYTGKNEEKTKYVYNIYKELNQYHVKIFPST